MASGYARRGFPRDLKCGRLFLFSLLVGLAVRFVVLPLTYEYDIYHWAVVIQNIESGTGLYTLDGYYYTPVWGYILGAVDAFWNAFLSIDVFGTQVHELLGVQNMENMNHVATITTPAFNTALKMFLIIVDVIVGLAVRRIATDLTDDARKGDIAFALWFLCPIAIYMSSVQGTFDSISGLLTMLSVMLVLRERYFAGGFMLSLGILLKLYPGFALPVIVALIYSRGKRADGMLGNLAMLFAGGIVAFMIVMAPTFADGTFMSAFTFITDRSGGGSLMESLFGTAGIIIALVLMVVFTVAMARSRDPDGTFVGYAMLALIGGIFANLGPQYPLVVIPLLCVYIATNDRSYVTCWILIGFGCFLEALVLNNYSLLMSTASYWGWPSFGTILSGLDWTEAYIFRTSSFRSLANTVFLLVGAAGLVLALLYPYEDRIAERFPKIASAIHRTRFGTEESR